MTEERPVKRQALEGAMGGDDVQWYTHNPFEPPLPLPLPPVLRGEAAVAEAAHSRAPAAVAEAAHPRAPFPSGVTHKSRDAYAQAAAVTRANDMDTRATPGDLSVLIRNVQVGRCT